MSVDAECEESLTPRDVCSSIPQAHRGFINSEPWLKLVREPIESMSAHINIRMN